MTSQATNHLATRIGRNVARARGTAGLKQREVAAALKMPENSVSRWERGSNVPSQHNLAALAELFGRDPGWFYVDHDASPTVQAEHEADMRHDYTAGNCDVEEEAA